MQTCRNLSASGDGLETIIISTCNLLDGIFYYTDREGLRDRIRELFVVLVLNREKLTLNLLRKGCANFLTKERIRVLF